nr:hypothetical protein [Burkholderia cepacia]
MLAIETTTPTISDSHSSAAGASVPSRENHENYFDMFLNELILLSKNITEHTATGTVAARLTPTIYIYPSPSTPILIFIKRWIVTQTLQRLTALHTITIADATPGDMHMQPSHHRENPIAQFSRSKLDISNCLRSLSRIHSGARPTPDHVAPLTGSK